MPKSNRESAGKPKKTKEIKKIYLDYAASIVPNAGSIHADGVKAKNKLENARSETASVLGARPSEIIFTSGGTESNNLAIQGVVLAAQNKIFLPHIVTTNIEHPSVLETFRMLKMRKQAEISVVPVEPDGIVDPKKIKKAVKKNTVLVSVMSANNEIGTIQPIREIAKEIRHYKKISGRDNIYFHTDAVQAVNYLDLSVERLGVDLLSLSGSKIEGAGRVGLLFKKKSVPLAPLFAGGDQEMGFRAGTENLDAIIKFSLGLASVQKIKDKESKRLAELRDYFLKKLPADATLNGDAKNRLPNNVNITFPKIPSDLLVIELSARGIMTSSKSACKSSTAGGSYVIRAIHPEIGTDIGGLRFSLGRDTTKKDIDEVLRSLSQILTKLKKWYN